MIAFLKNYALSLLAGAFLVIINFPLGWIGLAWFVHTAKKTGNTFFYCMTTCAEEYQFAHHFHQENYYQYL